MKPFPSESTLEQLGFLSFFFRGIEVPPPELLELAAGRWFFITPTALKLFYSLVVLSIMYFNHASI